MKSVLPSKEMPHLVLLGAGASLASFPQGDKYGRKLPLMNSLVEKLDLYNYIPNRLEGLITDFEKLYSNISNDDSLFENKKIIDKKVYEYFYEMDIPDKPTIYDYLILSLRKKDLIATFNWDPLLLKTMRRHSKIINLPNVAFLHGNVSVGICKHCNVKGYKYNNVCRHCNRSYDDMKLLYPIENKNYSADKIINNEWEILRHCFNISLYVTIFGYSAPDSDVDAKKLMLDALIKNKSREFFELEIIDIKTEEEVEQTWYDFIYSHHYSIIKNFKESYLWYHPRRSTDAFFDAYLMNNPWEDNPFPEFNDIYEMHQWIEPLLNEENKNV
jgi:NAD-dependent SIR2 family protein deacetylase